MKMKRLLILLSAVSLLLTATGCSQKSYSYQEGVTLSQRDFTIKSGDWYEETYEDGAAFLSVKLNVPEITNDIVNYGTVMGPANSPTAETPSGLPCPFPAPKKLTTAQRGSSSTPPI